MKIGAALQRLAACWIVAWLVPWCGAAGAGSFDDAASAPAPAATPAPPPADGWRRFEHARLGYSLDLPGAPKAGPEEAAGDVLVEQDGYRIELRPATSHRNRPLSGLAGELEAGRLGPEKVWQTKLAGGRTVLNGVEGYEALYEGGGRRTRLLILRLAGFDLMVMMTAADEAFARLRPLFDRVVGSFSPGAAKPTGADPGAGVEQVLLTARLPDEAGPQPATDFQVGLGQIWLLVRPRGIEPGRRLLATWYVVGAGGLAEVGREEAPIIAGMPWLYFRLAPADGHGWKDGVYRVEVTLDGDALAEVDFRVRPAIQPGQPAATPPAAGMERRGG